MRQLLYLNSLWTPYFLTPHTLRAVAWQSPVPLTYQDSFRWPMSHLHTQPDAPMLPLSTGPWGLSQCICGISAPHLLHWQLPSLPKSQFYPSWNPNHKRTICLVTWINLIANIKFTLEYHHQKHSFSVKVLQWITIDGTQCTGRDDMIGQESHKQAKKPQEKKEIYNIILRGEEGERRGKEYKRWIRGREQPRYIKKSRNR